MNTCKNSIICNNVKITNDLCIECECVFGKWRNRKRNNIEIHSKNSICPDCNRYSNILIYSMDNDNYMCKECFVELYFGKDFKIRLI